MFALRPGHLLHPYPAALTLHPSRCIDQEHLHPPKRDELEAPGRQPIVPWAALPTVRAHRPAICPRMQFHLQSRGGCALHPANRTIHETDLILWTRLRIVCRAASRSPPSGCRWFVHTAIFPEIGAGCSPRPNRPALFAVLSSHSHALTGSQPPTNCPESCNFKRPFSASGRVRMYPRVVKDAIRRSGMRDVSGPSAVRGARLRGRFGLARECRPKEAVGSGS